MGNPQKFNHVGGLSKDQDGLAGSMRSTSGEGLGSSENNSWNAQYRYMVAFADKIDFITNHLVDAKYDYYYSKKLLSAVTGLWHLFLGSPKGRELKDEKIKEINIRLKTAEIYLEIGQTEREVEILRKIFIEILQPMGDGYTFKGSRAKVKIRAGVAGDIDELVGRS